MTRTVVVTLDQFYRPQPGGIATYVRGLLGGLADLADPQWRVVGLSPRGPEPPELADLELERVVAPFDVRVLTRIWSRRAVGVPAESDVVHATTLAGPFAGGGPATRHCVALHDLLWRDEPRAFSPAGRRFHESRLRAVRRRGDLRIVTTAPGLAERLIAEGVERGRIFESRLGADLDAPAADHDVVRRVLASAGVAGPYVLYAGTREPRKNLRRLIEAHGVALGREPSLGPLVLVGPSGWGPDTPRDAVVLGRVERTLLRGLIRDAQALGYVPLAEGFGLPPVEALALGTPVLASTSTPSVTHNPLAVLVDPTNVEEIASGWIRAATSGHDVASRAARRASVEALTWRRCALDHLEAWR